MRSNRQEKVKEKFSVSDLETTDSLPIPLLQVPVTIVTYAQDERDYVQ